jgi:hypothetical protein
MNIVIVNSSGPLASLFVPCVPRVGDIIRLSGAVGGERKVLEVTWTVYCTTQADQITSGAVSQLETVFVRVGGIVR